MTETPSFLLETPAVASRGFDSAYHAARPCRSDLLANLEALLAKGGDGAALRLALASRYLDAGDAAAAVRHARGRRAARSRVFRGVESARPRVDGGRPRAPTRSTVYERGHEGGRTTRRPTGREGNARVQRTLKACCAAKRDSPKQG